MKVIIASIVLPYPLTSGGAQGVFNMIEELRNDNDITLIFPENADNTRTAMHELQQLWPDVDLRPYPYRRQLIHPRFFFDKARRAFNLKFRADNRRFQIDRILQHYGYYMTGDFKRFINSIINEKKPDLFQVEFYQYLKMADILPKGLKKIFIHHELRFVRNDRFLQPYSLSRKEARLQKFIEVEEIRDCNKYDAVVTVTDVDRQQLANVGLTVPLYTSTLAINTPTLNYNKWNRRVVFVGGTSNTPNLEGMEWFLNKVAPRINWKKGGLARSLDIVGKGWDERWVRHVNLSNVKVNLLGFVERLDMVANNSIMIVPILSGSGMRMKILEAAALGAPIITTSVGVEGIEFPDGEACLIADTPEQFAEALRRVMRDDQLRQRLTTGARRIYEEKYSRKVLAQRRQSIWETVLNPSLPSDATNGSNPS